MIGLVGGRWVGGWVGGWDVPDSPQGEGGVGTDSPFDAVGADGGDLGKWVGGWVGGWVNEWVNLVFPSSFFLPSNLQYSSSAFEPPYPPTHPPNPSI